MVFPGGSDDKQYSMQEIQIRFLSQGSESTIFAWGIPLIEEPGGYSPWGLKELHTYLSLICLPLFHQPHKAWILDKYFGLNDRWKFNNLRNFHVF